MNVGLVLSGGGAKGSFQMGALTRLYEEGLFASVICGASVGAINAVKLAEGGTAETQKAAAKELADIWWSMRVFTDVFNDTEWWKKAQDLYTNRGVVADVVTDLHQVYADARDVAGPHGTIDDLTRVVFETPRLLARALSTANRAVVMAEELGPDAEAIVTGFIEAESLMTLDPIAGLLRGGAVSLARVAGSGVQLRLAAVALESGETRYIDQNGAVLTSTGAVYSELPVGLPPACQPVADRLAAAQKELKDRYRDEVKAQLQAGARHRDAIRMARTATRQLEANADALQQELTECRTKHTAPTALRVGVLDGVVASASIPAAFPPVRLGQEHYVDGGVREIIPFAGAKTAGAEHTVVVSASPLTVSWNPWQMPDEVKFIGIALRGLDLALNEVSATDVPNGAALVIAPRFEVHDMLTVERGLIRINATYGYMCAADTIAQARIEHPTWNPVTGEAVKPTQRWTPQGGGALGGCGSTSPTGSRSAHSQGRSCGR